MLPEDLGKVASKAAPPVRGRLAAWPPMSATVDLGRQRPRAKPGRRRRIFTGASGALPDPEIEIRSTSPPR